MQLLAHWMRQVSARYISHELVEICLSISSSFLDTLFTIRKKLSPHSKFKVNINQLTCLWGSKWILEYWRWYVIHSFLWKDSSLPLLLSVICCLLTKSYNTLNTCAYLFIFHRVQYFLQPWCFPASCKTSWWKGLCAVVNIPKYCHMTVLLMSICKECMYGLNWYAYTQI